jgi:hypothetical protein
MQEKKDIDDHLTRIIEKNDYIFYSELERVMLVEAEELIR